MESYLNELKEIVWLYSMPIYGIISNKRHFFLDGELDDFEIGVERLKNYQSDLSALKSSVEHDNSLCDSEKKLVILGIQYYLNETKMFQHALPLEADKLGLINLNRKEKEKLVALVRSSEDELYWPRISDSPKELKYVISYLDSLYNQKKNLLDRKDRDIFLEFLQSKRKYVDPSLDFWSKERFEWHMIHRDDYCRCFELLLWFYDIQWWEVVVEERWNMAVSSNMKKILIPDDPSYEYLSLLRVCELFAHEIERHVISATNSEKTTKWKLWAYIKTEEWLAMNNEKFVAWDFDSIDLTPTVHHITTYIGEQCTSRESFDMIRIYKQLEDKLNIKDASEFASKRIKRIKRFYANELPWAMRKDASYRRWLLEIFTFFKSHNDITSDDFKRILNRAYSGKTPSDLFMDREYVFDDVKWLILPHWVWRYLYRKISNLNQWTITLNTSKLSYKKKKTMKEIYDILSKR